MASCVVEPLITSVILITLYQYVEMYMLLLYM